jgi:hypothetical protein
VVNLEGDNRPTYILSYSRWVRWGRIGAALLLGGTSVVRWVLAWINFFGPVVQAVQGAGDTSGYLGRIILDALAAQPLRPFVAAHLSLFLVWGALALLYSFLPDLALADHGLAVRTLLGWRLIPWTSIDVVRILSFQKPWQRLVLVQGTWTRWSPWPRLVSASLGGGFAPGVFFTSAIRDFVPLMTSLYHQVSAAVPGALFDDEFSSLPAQLVAEPMPTLDKLVDQAGDDGWPLSVSAMIMAAVPAGLVLVQLLILLLEGGIWWEPLAVIGLCAMEWLIGTFYLYALAEIFPSSVEIREAALLYPLPQIPRALLTIPMAMLIAARVPFLAAMLGLAGVVWAVILTAFLVQRVFRLESILPTAIGGAFQALYQFLILFLVFG